MLWRPYEGTLKWAVVVQRFSDSSSQYLNIDLGDIVYILRCCADWFYGFKANRSSERGAFPKICVAIMKNQLLAELDADLHIMFAGLTSSFMTAASFPLDQVISSLVKIVDLKESLSGELTEHETISTLKKLLLNVSLAQKDLDLPVLVRNEHMEPVDPYSETLVDFHKLHGKIFKQIHDARLNAQAPVTQHFNLRLQFDRLPVAEITLYLASQAITITGDLGVGSGAHVITAVNGTSVVDYVSNDRSSQCSAVIPTVQFGNQISRLTENVTINGYTQNSNEVTFLDLDPVQPREERILLLVVLHRVGYMHMKRQKAGGKGTVPILVTAKLSEDSSLRRPLGVACVDITRDLVQQTKSRWFDLSVISAISRPQSVTSMGRTVPVVTTGEQFQLDALLQLVKETPSSLWSTQSTLTTAHSASAIGGSGINLGAFAESHNPDVTDFCLKSVEVLNHGQSESFPTNPSNGRAFGRRYGLSPFLCCIETHNRKDVYINLISGDFFRGAKKQEKNIEVEISLRDNSGNLKPLGNDSTSLASRVFRSTVYYHKNHPRWSELFAIPLPPSSNQRTSSVGSSWTTSAGCAFQVDLTNGNQLSLDQSVPGGLAGDHVRFVCRHKSTTTPSKDKLIGVAFLRLQPSTSIPVLLADGVYQLLVHKMDNQQIESCAYLRESSFLSGPGVSGSSSSGSQGSTGTSALLSSSSLSGFAPSRQRHEYICVETRVCSCEHTTDENLTKVIFWQKYQEDLVMCLRQGIYLSRKDAELRKFVRPLVDRLIQILDSTVHSTNGLPQLNISLGYSVLMALARCYHDLLINQTHQDMIKAYLKSPHFHYPTVYQPYLRLLNSVLRDVLSTTSTSDISELRPQSGHESTSAGCPIDSKAIQMICSKIYWAFLVIVRSRQLAIRQSNSTTNSSASTDSEDSFFAQQIDQFFSQVHKLVSLNENRILRPILLKHLPEVLKDLLTVYPATKLAGFIGRLIERTLECSELPNHKILVETIQSDLFKQNESRELLLPILQRSLTTFFAENLNKELTAGRTETDVRMECWCDALLLFVSRILCVLSDRIQTTHSTPSKLSTAPELRMIVVTSGLVRWIMQQLSRIFVFIRQDQDAVARRSDSVEDYWFAHRFGRIRSCDSHANTVDDQASTAARLQPIVGCLTSVLLTLLQQLDGHCWIELIFHPGTTEAPQRTNVNSCRCVVCTRLQLIDVHDFLHELFTLFSMLHQYPAYRAPSRFSLTATDPGALRFDPHRKTSAMVATPLVRFGDTWVEMLIAASHVELCIIKLLTDLIILPLCTGCLADPQSAIPTIPYPPLQPDHPLSIELISMVQDCLCSFAVLQTHLCVETLPAVIQSRVDRAMLGQEKDMRQIACNQLVSIWDALGNQYKAQYIPIFLPTMMDMATIAIPSLQIACVNWVFDAILISPAAVERDFVSEVDRVMQWAGTGFAAEFSRLLEDRLIAACGPLAQNTHVLDTSRERLTRDLVRQVNCLLAYGEFLNHPSKLNEMLALHNLRTVYEKNGRTDMVLRYLYRLESLLAECAHEVERGNTLVSISKHYTWSDDPVDCLNISKSYIPYACISSRALRERLLLDGLDCLKRATDWERAIEVCNELIELYRDVSPNYSKLGSILNEQADLYQRIVSSQHARTPYHYYLLMFNGPGFASFIVDRFVYRTSADSSDVSRILAEEFPQATRLISPPEPGHISDHPTIFASSNLIPQACLPNHLAGHGVDSRIKSYYMRNNVNCFTHIRHMKPIVTSEGREQPVAEETRYFVQDSMPNIMPIEPVIRTETCMLDPIQLAIINVQEMIRRLEQHLPLMSETTDVKNLNPMIGTLTSSILSPVSGGLPKLLESLEFSDDAGQESNFSKLSDSVLELLEMQLIWMEYWYKMDPPPPQRASDADRPVTGNLYLQNTVDAYEPLVRDMSRIFGFSIDHLKVDHLRFGPVASVGGGLGTGERRSSSGTVNLRQTFTSGSKSPVQPLSTTRVFHRFDNLLTSEVAAGASLRLEKTRLGVRSNWDHGSMFLNETITSRAPSAPDSLSVLLSSEPPPLPERPTSLGKLDPVDYLLSVDRSGSPRNSASSESQSHPADSSSLKRLPPRPSRSSPLHRPGGSNPSAHEDVAPPLPPRPSASAR